MRRYCNSLMRRIGRFQDDVTPNLVHPGVSPMPAEGISKLVARNIAGELHTKDNTSSRTR